VANPDGYKYYHQVQANMFLTGARQCDFVVWCPQEFVIFSVQYDESWADNADYLVEFYAKYMLPVLTKGHIPD
jgi:hypothetical protein